MYITLANDQLDAQIFNFKLAKVILRCKVSETSKQIYIKINNFYTAQCHWKHSKYPQLRMTLISATKFATSVRLK
jgi:hypothetical protein